MWKFASSHLDRNSLNRADLAHIQSKLSLDHSVLVLVNQNTEILFSANGIEPANGRHYFSSERFNLEDILQQYDSIYLGDLDNTPWFAVVVDGDDPQFTTRFHDHWRGLRQSIGLIDEPVATVLAYAKAICYWHLTHQFCGTCGSDTRPLKAGHQRRCDGCDTDHFPRTDSAIITSVTYQDQLLLARQHSWPDKRYSVLAGFVEPGESFEQAVQREVAEESGLSVSKIQYVGSQPWPFPSSLMVGFTAVADSLNFELLDQELEHALWVSADSLAQQLQVKEILLPTRQSISFALINRWANSQQLDLTPWL